MADAKSEQKEVRRDGGKAVANSGRGKHAKGDAVLEPFLYDVKEYEKSYGLTKSNWAKVCSDAWTNGRRVPALKVVLGPEGGDRLRLWVVDDAMFHEMLEAWKEKYEI